MIICHRGIKIENENTLENIIKTKDLTHKDILFGVEFDIQLTKDNKLVCYHDENLLRLHNIDKRIVDNNYEDLNVKLPFLKDILEKIKDNDNFFIDIELKYYDKLSNENYQDEYCSVLLKEVEQIKKKDNLIISSFNYNLVKKLKKISNLNVGKIFFDEYNEKQINKLINLGVSYFVIHKDIIEMYLKYLDKNIKIVIYTLFNKKNYSNELNDENLVKTLKKYNIGYITNNYKKMISIFINF